eukprot:2353908-Rhodomonas_salina.2
MKEEDANFEEEWEWKRASTHTCIQGRCRMRKSEAIRAMASRRLFRQERQCSHGPTILQSDTAQGWKWPAAPAPPLLCP